MKAMFDETTIIPDLGSIKDAAQCYLYHDAAIYAWKRGNNIELSDDESRMYDVIRRQIKSNDAEDARIATKLQKAGV